MDMFVAWLNSPSGTSVIGWISAIGFVLLILFLRSRADEAQLYRDIAMDIGKTPEDVRRNLDDIDKLRN